MWRDAIVKAPEPAPEGSAAAAAAAASVPVAGAGGEEHDPVPQDVWITPDVSIGVESEVPWGGARVAALSSSGRGFVVVLAR